GVAIAARLLVRVRHALEVAFPEQGDEIFVAAGLRAHGLERTEKERKLLHLESLAELEGANAVLVEEPRQTLTTAIAFGEHRHILVRELRFSHAEPDAVHLRPERNERRARRVYRAHVHRVVGQIQLKRAHGARKRLER